MPDTAGLAGSGTGSRKIRVGPTIELRAAAALQKPAHLARLLCFRTIRVAVVRPLGMRPRASSFAFLVIGLGNKLGFSESFDE
ncbi:MAG: hypothetical protein C0483_06685 [Pirellula sp.]|nr:hypothetical protein [Pirellula sp.]